MKRILGFLTLLFLLFTSGCNQQPEGESAISEESTVSEESTFEYYKGRPQDVSIPVQCYETPPENPVVLFDDAQGAYLFNYVEEELVGTTKTIVVNGKELVGDYRKTSMSWVPAPIVDYFCAGSDEDRYEAVLFGITQLYDELESISFIPNYNCVIDIPIGVEEAREICKAFIRENTDIDLDAYNTDAPPLREPELYPDGMYRETYYFSFEKMVNGIMESALSFEIGADGYFRRFVWWHSRFDEMIEIPDWPDEYYQNAAQEKLEEVYEAYYSEGKLKELLGSFAPTGPVTAVTDLEIRLKELTYLHEHHSPAVTMYCPHTVVFENGEELKRELTLYMLIGESGSQTE